MVALTGWSILLLYVLPYMHIYSLSNPELFCCLKKNQNAPRPSEHPPVKGGKMSKRLGGIKGCKYKTSSHLNGFPYGGTIGDESNTIIVCNDVVSHIQRIGCQPEKNTLHGKPLYYRTFTLVNINCIHPGGTHTRHHICNSSWYLLYTLTV